MAANTDDYITISNIIKYEIHKHKKQKKPQENSKNVEEDNLSLLKKVEKKMKKTKKSTQLTTIVHNKKTKKLYTTICNDNDKYLNKGKSKGSNLNKNDLINCISISNASEEDKELPLLKKKKKKKGDKKKVENDENLNNDIVTLKVDKHYKDKHLYEDETVDFNFNKDEFTRSIPIANDSEGDSLFKKKKKKKERDIAMVENDENLNNDIVTLKVDKHLYENETVDFNFNKDEFTRTIPIANDSEGDSLFKKKKKKKERDIAMVENDENLNNDIVTLNVDKHYNDKHLYEDETVDFNFNKDEFTRTIPIANDSEGDSLFKKKKKKKERDIAMVENDENFNKDIVTLNVDKHYNDKHLYEDETVDFNFNKDEFTRTIPIANDSEGDSLFKKKKKKKERDIAMVENDENLNNDIVTLNVDKHYNDKHLYEDETVDFNFNKDEFTRTIPIANDSEGDSLFKKKKKKKERDIAMVENDENFKKDIVTLNVDKHYNDKHLYEDETVDFNFNKDEFTRTIPIANDSEGDSLFKKKKKKKERDIAMVENDENLNNDIVTLKVDKHLYENETVDFNFNKDEFTRTIPIANDSEGDSLFKKKKKKKERDIAMVENDENFNKDIVTLNVDKHYNDKHLYEDETVDFNFNKDEFTRTIPIANDSEGDSLFKKKKKKKERDIAMVENDENLNNDIVTLNVDKHYNDKHLYEDETVDFNFNKDEFTRTIPIANDSEGDSLFKKKKKKKERDIAMVENDENFKKDIVTLNVDKHYNDKHLYEDETVDFNFNKDEFTRTIPIANDSEGDSLFKKKKKKKERDIAMVENDENLNNDIVTLKVDKHLYENETVDFNFNKDEFTRTIPIANDSEGDSLFKKKKKKKERDIAMVENDENFNKDIVTLNVDKHYNDKHLYEDETVDFNFNKDEFTRTIPIANDSEGDSLFKKKKKKKERDIAMVENDENLNNDIVTLKVDKHLYENETVDFNFNKDEFTRTIPIANDSEGDSLFKKKKKKKERDIAMVENDENFNKDIVTLNVDKHYNDKHLYEDETVDFNFNKDEFTRTIPIANDSEGDSLFKKKKKKKERDIAMVENDENLNNDIVTLNVDKHYNDKHLYEDETVDFNFNKDEFTRTIPIANDSEGDSLFKKKKKKKERDIAMVENDENFKKDIVTLNVDKHYNDKHLYEDETVDFNFNKDEFTRTIPIANDSEGDSLFKKKKKKKERDIAMVENDENLNNDIVTLKVDKHLYENETVDFNFNKDEFTRTIPIANDSEGDSLFKKKKKKKERDIAMVENDENFNKDIVTLNVDKHYNDKHLYEDETVDFNFNKDEFTRTIPIANDSEGDSLFKKKKKKKERDIAMVENDENLNNDIVTLKVDKHLYENETVDFNFNKDEFTRTIPIANDSEGDSLFKKKKKKKERDIAMVENDENFNKDIVTLNVDKHYNDKHLYEDETVDFNFNKDEFTRTIPIANDSEGDSLFKKKKKKKERDIAMVENDENLNNDIVTLKVDKHLYENETVDFNFNKDEFTRTIPIANDSEGDSLFKKKKKKKERDIAMVENDENFNKDIVTLNVDKHYNDKHLYEDETVDFNFNKDEFTRTIPIANDSEGDSLFKKKKKKKERDIAMVENDENLNNDIVTLNVDKHYNDKHLYEDETVDFNFNKDEFTRTIPIANDSEGDSLFKKMKEKKKSDKKMVQKDKLLKNEKSLLNVEQFYNETIDDNIKYLNKINLSTSNFNKDVTRSVQMANSLEDDKEFTLLKIPLKKVNRKKNKSKIAINVGTESSKYVTVQKNLKNMDDPKENTSEEQSNEVHNDSGMIINPYNLKISKVHKQYPELFQKLLKKKKKNKIKSIKVITNKEVMSLKKSNKCKREATDKEYSKNNFPQSVDMDVETYDSNNYIGGKKLELFSSQDDYKSEYRTMTDTNSNMINTIDNSRISKVHKEEYAELVKKSLKNKKRIQKKVIKVITSKEVMSPKKSNKRIRQTTDEEYSKNDSSQSVDINVETCFNSYNYIGEDCGNKLDLFDSRDDHPSEYRNITDTVMYLGQYCNQISNNANGVFIHENVLTGKIPIQCDVCFKTFISKSKLHVHERTHTGEKPYACNYCGRSFSHQGTLVKHYRTHTGEKPYVCNVCGRSFSVHGSLVTHNRTHTGEKPYACNYCGRSFSQQGTLVTHNRTHTGEKPYACNYCGRSFSQQGTLVKHYRTHTGEKPYACNYCGRSFSQQGTLVKHYRTHTGEKPYLCNVCGRSFSVHGNLVTHSRTHTGEKPYACNYCGRSFSQQGTLVIHKRTHTGEKPFECYYCEKKLISSSARIKHIRRDHY